MGLHGWALFDGALSQPPLHLSSKLCNCLTQALLEHYSLPHPAIISDSGAPTNWTDDLDPNIALDITQLPLAAHGVVQQRTEIFLAQLNQFSELIKRADHVLVASHSQGTIVAGKSSCAWPDQTVTSSAAKVLAQLITFRSLDPKRQKTLLLAMVQSPKALQGTKSTTLQAGIHHGPFPDAFSVTDQLKSTKELFKFSQPNSQVESQHSTTTTVTCRSLRASTSQI